MIHEEDNWCTIIPSNVCLFKCELGDTAINYLHGLIEKAKTKPGQTSFKPTLAGNIQESIILEDDNGYLFDNHLSYAAYKFVEENSHRAIQHSKGKKLKLDSLWVNFQNKHDFNPVHFHNAILSFVIWMKIPTHYEDQYRLPIAANSNNPSASDFEFLYTNILGEIERMDVKMSPEMEGTLMLFPSTLMHQVYPFYDTDEQRISIAGNIIIDNG